jgi:regulator of sirC expression with transglutaminase-like and TPR domain
VTEKLKTTREELALLLKEKEGSMDLARAALLLAQDEYPGLNPALYLDQISSLAKRVAGKITTGRDPLATVAALNSVLFEEEDFKGNAEEYYDPRNSFLNEVLDRRTGIPITLSLLYLDVARRADIPMAGIGLPGHFIVGLISPGRTIYVDPFHQGQLMTVKECADRVAKIFDGQMAFTPDHLDPVDARGILFRLLTNLKNIYMESRSFAKGHSVIDKMVLLAPNEWAQVRDRGVVRYHLKHFQPALADLNLYLQNEPEAPDRPDIIKLEKLILKEMKNPS